MMLAPTDFYSPEWDQMVTRWLAGKLTTLERRDWIALLEQDAQFREEFCDWLKGFREPGSAMRAKESA